ncbi:MAG TPA: acetylxylan esterase [Clostridia bacterium]|nr:acetylxylan esterase [Clostridia bacterium]
MFERFLDNYCNPEHELFDYVCQKAIEGLEKEENEKNSINSRAQWKDKAESIRKSFIESIGSLDFDRCDLNPEYKGDIDKGEYIIRKVIFQSLPGFYVTANLYIPKNIKEPVPGILFCCGHSKPAKAEPRYQLAAIELALNDMVVLAVDPPGQGEIIQMPERHDIDWGVREHSYIGLTCTLAGMSIARYFIWNLMRAIDLLCSLEFVDDTRIGATGNSGGGTQTSYISLVDERIKAAAPGCYLNGRKQYMPRGHAHDSEQNIFNCMNFGLDYGDFISCFAPKPFRILSQQYDFFPIEGTLYSLQRAKKVYSLYDAEDKVDIVIDKEMHGLSDTLRHGTVEFFSKYLTGTKPADVDPYPYLETEQNLFCTKSGCVIGELPGARPLDEIVYDDAIGKRKINEDLESSIKNVFEISEFSDRPYEKRINPFDFYGYEGEKVFWLDNKGITNAAIYFKGKDSGYVSYVLFEDGTGEIERRSDEIIQLLGKGDVFVLDLCGMGAVKPVQINNGPFYDMYGTMHKICNDLLMMGSSLMELWINDILLASTLTDKKIRLIAYGKLQPAAIISTYLSKKIVEMITADEGIDFERIMKCHAPFIPELEVFGFTRHLNLNEISAALRHEGKI